MRKQKTKNSGRIRLGGSGMTMDQIRKAAGEITSNLPEKIYTRKDVKLVILDVLKKLEEVEK